MTMQILTRKSIGLMCVFLLLPLIFIGKSPATLPSLEARHIRITNTTTAAKATRISSTTIGEVITVKAAMVDGDAASAFIGVVENDGEETPQQEHEEEEQQASKQHKTENFKSNNNKKKNAYSWQLGGCNPSDAKPMYRFILYGIYIAVFALKKYGSKADFHVWIEMMHESSHKQLPSEEERIFNDLGVQMHYIPTHPGQSFYRTTLQKFRMLGLEQYQHVFNLDADVLPLTNLDYIFDLIDHGVLRQNVGFMGGAAPVNAGTFILSPYPGALEEINTVINKKEQSEWDPVVGWGHEIKAPDRHVMRLGERRTWDFWGGTCDQGLLLYWIKYYQKDASIFVNNGKIEHWVQAEESGEEDGQLVKLLETENNAFEKLDSFKLPEEIDCLTANGTFCQQPRKDQQPRKTVGFFHFAGPKQKPWCKGLPEDYSSETHRRTVLHYWFSLLEDISQQYDLGLNLEAIKLAKKERNTEGYNLKQMSHDIQNQGFTTLID